MSYPMLVNWINMKRVNKNTILVYDKLGKGHYEIDDYTAWFASHLDGKTNPYTIDRSCSDDVVEEILDTLEELDLLRHPHIVYTDLAEVFITLWIPNVTHALRRVASIINKVLLFSWLPVLILSFVFLFNSDTYISDDYTSAGIIIGAALGITFHEFSHMCACLAYGGDVYELGVFFKIVLPGAYTMTDTSRIKSRMQRVQVNAAGVEMNFLLAGVAVFLIPCLYELSGFFLFAAASNITLGLFNLILVPGLDGCAIIGELIGIDNIPETITAVRKSKSRKRGLAGKELNGKLTVVACYIINSFKIVIPIILIINVLEMI